MAEVQRFEDRGDDLIVWVVETDNPAFAGTIGMAADATAMPEEALVAEGLKPRYRGIVYLCQKALGKMPVEVSAAIIDHELGHLVLGHLSHGITPNANGVVIVEQFEVDADAYAAAIHGREVVSRMVRYAMLETSRKENQGRFSLTCAKKAMRSFHKDPVIAARLRALAA